MASRRNHWTLSLEIMKMEENRERGSQMGNELDTYRTLLKGKMYWHAEKLPIKLYGIMAQKYSSICKDTNLQIQYLYKIQSEKKQTKIYNTYQSWNVEIKREMESILNTRKESSIVSTDFPSGTSE